MRPAAAHITHHADHASKSAHVLHSKTETPTEAPMIYQASFKGLLLPQGEKQLKVPQLNTVYDVQVFEDPVNDKRSKFKARLVGGGRLDVLAYSIQTAKVKTEGLFKERISEW